MNLSRSHAISALVTTFAVAGLLQFPTAMAQESASNQGFVEEIIVTAERRTQNVQEVPTSISVISANRIEEMGIQNTQDLQNIVPGLTIRSSQIGQNNFSIRGIGEANDDVSTDSGVGVYVDDVYMARTSASNLSLYDLERVEVLRGPQGTLYGRNTAGGSINIITSKPTEMLTGKFAVDVGDEGRLNTQGFISGPLSDSFFAKASFAVLKRDGIMKNNFDGKEGNEVDTKTGRVGFRYVPSDRSEFLLTLDHETTKPGPSFKSLGPDDGFENVASGGPQPASRPERTVNVNNSASEEFETSGLMARYNYLSEAATTSVILGWRTEETFYNEDFDRTTSNALNEVHDEEGEWGSLELRVTSAEDGPWSFDGRLDWTAGLYYFTEDTDKSISFPSTVFGFVFCNFILPPDVCPGVAPGTPSAVTYLQNIDTQAYAAFAHMSWDFSEVLSMKIGLRYTDEDKDFDAMGTSTVIPAGPFNPLLGETINCDGSKSFTNLSGKFALEYMLDDNKMLYGQFSQGYRSGGYNGQAFTNAEACGGFDEEVADNYEVGLKADWFDRRLRTNVSVFLTDYKDLQVGVVPQPNSTPTTTNAADAEITGGELELWFHPTERLSISANVSVLDAEFVDFITYEQGVQVDKSGQPISRVPELTYNIGIGYAVPLANGAILNFRGDYVFEDETNVIGVDLPEWETTNFRISYESAANWRIAAWVRNAFDETYWTVHGVSGTAATNATARLLNEPRTVGVTFAYEFGN